MLVGFRRVRWDETFAKEDKRTERAVFLYYFLFVFSLSKESASGARFPRGEMPRANAAAVAAAFPVLYAVENLCFVSKRGR